MATKLKVFVSGKERELDDERASAKKTIEKFGLEAEGSEVRPASANPVTSEYSDEARTSDVYVGIFWQKFSEPTKTEFDIARREDIPPLIFIKKLKDNEKREAELEEFLKRISDAQIGITYREYDNSVDLEEKLSQALSHLLSRKFRDAKECKKRMEEMEKQKELELVAVEPTAPTVVAFTFPDMVKLGEVSNVSAKISGFSTNAFIDLQLVDPDGKIKYYPDPKSWDSVLDMGKLNLKQDEPYSNIWQFGISMKNKPGKYKARIELYEDIGDPSNKQRKLVAYKEKEFEVVSE